MKRHEKLQDLSREHHDALRLALHAKRAALSGDVAQVAASALACVNAFSLELDPHFVIEENDLLPPLAQSGEPELAQRTLNEHTELRRLVAQLRQPDAATLLGFSELLSAHVRFEERELFEVIERHIGNKAFARSI
jgi:hemerythrin-like domain-containing protein